jgi:hypothetical protein
MKINHKKTVIASVVAVSLNCAAVPAQATIYNMNWTGLFTIVSLTGNGLNNTSYPYYGDPTWGYGLRSQISGSMSLDSVTGAGTATIAPFEFCNSGPAVFHDISLQSIGNGTGGPGSLFLGDMLFDWNGNNGINVKIALDAAGLLGALPNMSPGDVINQASCALSGSNCSIAATEGLHAGADYYPMGALPVATTTYNVNSAGTAIVSDDGIGGSPMDNGPFPNFNINIDMTSVTLTSINPVPVPAAIWLFGTGLVGLFGFVRRKHH